VLKESRDELIRECCYDGDVRRVHSLVCDVRDPESCLSLVKSCISKYSKLTILINGAAGNFLANAHSLTANGFKTVMEIDVCGSFNMCIAAHRHLKESAAGDAAADATGGTGDATGGTGIKRLSKIVNISATLHYGATFYQVHASAAKAAVDSMTRSLALEWGKDGIRVVGVAPGPIRGTPGLDKLAKGALNDDGALEEMVAESIPLGRMGSKTDIGNTVVFLCCNHHGSSYITGETVVVDGGQWLYRTPIVDEDVVDGISRRLEKKDKKSKL
jgi:peroxisomal 2,4-dienoyl-CoA reductase